jgi:nucleoside-diphosphate-sugar epimerase
MNPRRELITGAAGNLGAKLAVHSRSSLELVLLDEPDGDLSVWDELWVSRFEGVDAVVHLAGDPVAYHSWDELTGPNIDAVLNVFEAAVRAGVKRLIFASFNHVMGGYQDGEPIPITTSLPPKPGLRYFADGADRFSGAYAAGKLFGERLGQVADLQKKIFQVRRLLAIAGRWSVRPYHWSVMLLTSPKRSVVIHSPSTSCIMWFTCGPSGFTSGPMASSRPIFG